MDALDGGLYSRCYLHFTSPPTIIPPFFRPCGVARLQAAKHCSRQLRVLSLNGCDGSLRPGDDPDAFAAPGRFPPKPERGVRLPGGGGGDGGAADAALPASVSGRKEHVAYTKLFHGEEDPSGRYALDLSAPWAR